MGAFIDDIKRKRKRQRYSTKDILKFGEGVRGQRGICNLITLSFTQDVVQTNPDNLRSKTLQVTFGTLVKAENVYPALPHQNQERGNQQRSGLSLGKSEAFQ